MALDCSALRFLTAVMVRGASWTADSQERRVEVRTEWGNTLEVISRNHLGRGRKAIAEGGATGGCAGGG